MCKIEAKKILFSNIYHKFVVTAYILNRNSFIYSCYLVFSFLSFILHLEYRRLLKEAKLELKKSKRKDYYKILGVSQNADDTELKKAYRKEALKHHPGIAAVFFALNQDKGAECLSRSLC